jgi:hypothetical protein
VTDPAAVYRVTTFNRATRDGLETAADFLRRLGEAGGLETVVAQSECVADVVARWDRNVATEFVDSLSEWDTPLGSTDGTGEARQAT